jgi:uncharacterized protein
MTKDIWINLPVKDVKKSKEFFTSLGLTFDSSYMDNDEGASLVIGDKDVVVMLFKDSVFENFTGIKITDPKLGAEVLLSIGAESREEVDEMAEKVAQAGGTIFAQAGAQDNWMYGCGFADLDGHLWNVLYMDMSKMPM